MTSTSSPLRAWGQLARVSLAPSALADVACGVLLGFAGRWPNSNAPWILMASSLAIYHGAMMLNDWADREHDAQTRPERPIPSGRIDSTSALTAGTLLLFFGVSACMAIGASTALWMGIVAWLAWIYTTRGRGPWLGPLLLAACRMGNLGAGLVAAEDSPVYARESIPWTWSIPVAYGVYVFVISRLGRMEDREDDRELGNRPRVLIALLAAILLAIPCLPTDAGVVWHFGRGLAFLVAACGAFGLVRLALKKTEWTRGDVMQAMGAALRRLLIVTASAALLHVEWTNLESDGKVGLIVAGAILAGYPVSFFLRGLFPPS